MSAEDAAYAHDPPVLPANAEAEIVHQGEQKGRWSAGIETMPCYSYGQHLAHYVNSAPDQLRFKLSPGDLNAKER